MAPHTDSDNSPDGGRNWLIDIAVRLAAGAVALATGAVFINALYVGSHTYHGENTSELIGGLMAVIFLGIPGGYVAIKGVSFSPAGKANRRRGITYIFVGLAAIAGAGLLSLVGTLLSSILAGPSLMVAVGLLAAGLVSVVAGVVALTTGQDMGDPFDDKH